MKSAIPTTSDEPRGERLTETFALDATDEARNFFRVRAAQAKPGALLRALDAIPDNPPVAGDEFEA